MSKSLIDLLETIANKYYGGHFTLMKFTTNWRCGFGTVESRDDITKLAEGKTKNESILKCISKEFDIN